jgi:HSP20 family protein
VDLPGVRSEQVDLNVQDGVLTLKASVAPRWREGARGMLCEYGVGDYVREFRLGEAIDTTRISAEMKNGVLTLKLPKVEAARPRKIQVAIK